MKKSLLVLFALSASVANAQMKASSAGFAAPTIIGKSNVYDATPGDIIYDQTDSTFYGRDHTGNWLSFSNDGANKSLSNLTTTAINADLKPATNNSINLGDQSGHEFASISVHKASFDTGKITIGDDGYGHSMINVPYIMDPSSSRGVYLKTTDPNAPDLIIGTWDGSNIVLHSTGGNGSIWLSNHLRSTWNPYSSTISASTTVNTGSSGTCTLTNSTDTVGQVTIVTSGTGISSGDVCDINFLQTYASAPFCTLTPANAAAGVNAQQYYATTTTAKLSVNFGTAGASSGTYAYNYYCMETASSIQ